MDHLLSTVSQIPGLLPTLLAFLIAAKLWRKSSLRYLAFVLLAGGTISGSVLTASLDLHPSSLPLVNVIWDSSIFTGTGLTAIAYLSSASSRDRLQSDLAVGLLLGAATGAFLSARQADLDSAMRCVAVGSAAGPVTLLFARQVIKRAWQMALTLSFGAVLVSCAILVFR